MAVPLKLMMVAGEASADMHGARLLAEIRRLSGRPCQAFGVGGEQLEREGLEVMVPADRLSIVGVTAVFQRLPELLGYFKNILKRCEAERPDLAILIDLPDFNLRLAKKLKRMGIPVLYYISPQVWAWRQYRVNHIRKYVDKMLVLFPFEQDFYQRFNVPARFVGHPLLDLIPPRSGIRTAAEVKAHPRLALLPGSRRSEVEHHRDLLLGVVENLLPRYPGLEIRLPVAPTLSLDTMKALYQHPRIQVEKSNAHEVLEWADIAGVASGTATLETALVGTPFFLYYLVTPFHYFLFRLIIRWKHSIGMPNLLLERPITQEFFQDRARVDLLTAECIRLIEDSPYREEMARSLACCRTVLGNQGASQRAAEEALSLIQVKRGALLAT